MPRKKYNKYFCLTKIENGFLYYFCNEYKKNEPSVDINIIHRSVNKIKLEIQETERDTPSNYFFRKEKHSTKWLHHHYKVISLQNAFFALLKKRALHLRDVVTQNALGEISEYKMHLNTLEQKHILEEYPQDFNADHKRITFYSKFLRISKQLLDSQIDILNIMEEKIQRINEDVNEKIHELAETKPLYHFKLNLILHKYHEDYAATLDLLTKSITYLTTSPITQYANQAIGLISIFCDMAHGRTLPPQPVTSTRDEVEKTERIRDVTDLELSMIRKTYRK